MECICIKTHFKVPHRSIRARKLISEGIIISNKRIYIKKGSFCTYTQEELLRARERIVNGLFVYYDYGDLDSYFESFYTTDPMAIRKEKLKRIATSNNQYLNNSVSTTNINYNAGFTNTSTDELVDD